MTLLLPVDAAYAFDYLAVLMVKRDNGLDVEEELARVETFLRAQVGDSYNEVMASREFQLSFIANGQVFDAIERAHKGDIGAREVQEINYRRFKAKQAMQERFWPGAELAERKTKF